MMPFSFYFKNEMNILKGLLLASRFSYSLVKELLFNIECNGFYFRSIGADIQKLWTIFY